MKSTRDRILKTLLTHPQSTINALAKSVDINAISVRHHLANLQAERLVEASEERHGVGRPRLVYSLTEKGIEKFPTRYLNLTNKLLDQLNKSLPDETIQEIFYGLASDTIEKHIDTVTSASSMEEKLDLTIEILNQEGFSVEWERVGDQYAIHSTTCPYHQISQKHPEICIIDKTILSQLLSVPLAQNNCIANGEKRCSYITKAQQK
jgi:DeoR family transcriptional regulator, suf operon transcriptional repressor